MPQETTTITLTEEELEARIETAVTNAKLKCGIDLAKDYVDKRIREAVERERESIAKYFDGIGSPISGNIIRNRGYK